MLAGPIQLSAQSSSGSAVAPGIAQADLEPIDIDTLEEKPWRAPGAVLSDYFNYGFTEDTWRSYTQKQVLSQKFLSSNFEQTLRFQNQQVISSAPPPARSIPSSTTQGISILDTTASSARNMPPPPGSCEFHIAPLVLRHSLQIERQRRCHFINWKLRCTHSAWNSFVHFVSLIPTILNQEADTNHSRNRGPYPC